MVSSVRTLLKRYHPMVTVSLTLETLPTFFSAHATENEKGFETLKTVIIKTLYTSDVINFLYSSK